jgi:tetratricopeptide (TPR) repeat protein
MQWEYLIHLFNEETKSYFYNTSLEIAENSDATDYINGLLELENNNPEIALYHFNRIDDYVANYFIGLCYLETENYQNSIKQNLLFLNELELMINNIKEIDLLNNSDLLIVKWNIYNDLGYAYNRIFEFENALSFYNKSLQIFSLEEAFIIRHSIKVDKNLDDFSIFINNYLLSLEQTNKFTQCIEILDFVISKYPNDFYYKDRKTKLIEKTEKHSFANEIINTLFRVKKPFNITSFQETKIISKEKILEDMIVEQIKYGFNVFGKRLEIYEDSEIFGRQYYIKSVNGILDLLLIDKTQDILYVVELKRNEAGIEVVEQIENYIKGLKAQLNREVKGIISLHKPDRNLIELVKTKTNIELYTYDFQFKNIE